jgi:hypothetical protein
VPCVAEIEGESIVQRVFGGLLRSDLTCCGCGYTSTAHDPFLDISLDIDPPPFAPLPPGLPPRSHFAAAAGAQHKAKPGGAAAGKGKPGGARRPPAGVGVGKAKPSGLSGVVASATASGGSGARQCVCVHACLCVAPQPPFVHVCTKGGGQLDWHVVSMALRVPFDGMLRAVATMPPIVASVVFIPSANCRYVGV